MVGCQRRDAATVTDDVPLGERASYYALCWTGCVVTKARQQAAELAEKRAKLAERLAILNNGAG